MPNSLQTEGSRPVRRNVNPYLHEQLLLHLQWNEEYERFFSRLYGPNNCRVAFFQHRCQCIRDLILVGRREANDEDRLRMFDIYMSLAFSDQELQQWMRPWLSMENRYRQR